MVARTKAAVFVEPVRIFLSDKPVPDLGPLKGEYPVEPGLTIATP